MIHLKLHWVLTVAVRRSWLKNNILICNHISLNIIFFVCFYQTSFQKHLKMYKITAGVSDFCPITNFSNGQSVQLVGMNVENVTLNLRFVLLRLDNLINSSPDTARKWQKKTQNIKLTHFVNRYSCSPAQNTFNRAGTNQQKHMLRYTFLIAIRHQHFQQSTTSRFGKTKAQHLLKQNCKHAAPLI